LYSLYIGQYNDLNIKDLIPLSERYARIPIGIYTILTQKIGFVLFLMLISINAIIISRNYQSIESKKILKLAKWIGIFSIFYILMLPLGGFRVYRENIIRYDTIMPITLGAIYVFGATTFYLIKNISAKFKHIYTFSIIVFLSIFMYADQLDTRNYECEKQALEKIAQSTENIVKIDSNCPIMDWKPIKETELSTLNSELFFYWNITKERKMYYQQ